MPKSSMMVLMITGSCSVELKPLGPDQFHSSPSSPISSSSMSSPGQRVVMSAVAMAAAGGAISMVTELVLVHPPPSVMVTVYSP